MSAKVARIAGNKCINEVIELMKAMSDIGHAVVLNKAKEMVLENPRHPATSATILLLVRKEGGAA